MVDESQKVFTIDFPQMVSTNHADALFYFERDQNCVQIIFKRKYNFICDRKHKLDEIEIIKHIDEEVKASGYNAAAKHTADDAALEGYMAAARHEEAGEGGEGDIKDDGNDEDDEDEEEDHPDQLEELGKGTEDKEVENLGDIEAEMKAMNMESTHIEDSGKPVDNEHEEKALDEEVDDEDWETKIEKRKQMKALKKEKLATERVKVLENIKAETKHKKEEIQAENKEKEENGEEEQEGESESDEKETELIKKALKKKFKKKKLFKAKKNHPKQFNEAVREQMDYEI